MAGIDVDDPETTVSGVFNTYQISKQRTVVTDIMRITFYFLTAEDNYHWQ